MNGTNFFGGSTDNKANSQTGSQFSKKSGVEAETFTTKRTKFMENIRRNAREQITKSRRQQPTMFTSGNQKDEKESGSTSINYEHLNSIPNKDQLIVKLQEFNEIDVEGFSDPEINEIANTLRNGNL